MRRRQRNGIPSKYLLVILSIVCIVMLFVSYATNFTGGPLKTVANYIFVPMQKGLDYVGNNISSSNEDAKSKKELIQENAELRKQVNDLTTQITNIRLQQAELDELQELFELDQQYDYKTTGARIIAKSTSNWYDTFTLNKGYNDGIEVNMNVIAGSGLVGIITEVGPNYSVVRAIIDDTSNVSGMVVDTGDNLIVSGNLMSMTESNLLDITNLEDADDLAKLGDAVVTSNISDKFLPGILIGYITSIDSDSSSLTKTGTITPVVDFKHLKDVLIILETKESAL